MGTSKVSKENYDVGYTKVATFISRIVPPSLILLQQSRIESIILNDRRLIEGKIGIDLPTPLLVEDRFFTNDPERNAWTREREIHRYTRKSSNALIYQPLAAGIGIFERRAHETADGNAHAICNLPSDRPN